MAGVSTKEIKNRIRSMESTKQITKAMEMVAASKLRRAQARVVGSRPYFETLYATMTQIARSEEEFSSEYLQGRPVRRRLYIVIAGDRGLAGGYNSNVLKLAAAAIEQENALVLPVGKKAVDFFRSRKTPILSENCALAAQMGIGDCFSVSRQLCKDYLAGEFDEVILVYTRFVSVLSQIPDQMRLLPLKNLPQGEESHAARQTAYEGSPEDIFETIVPEYLGGVFYGALCESLAAEQAARRTAMDSATQNAEDMIADLSLKFNRARQAAITQEITEIVAGS